MRTCPPFAPTESTSPAKASGRDGDPAILLIHGLATPLTGWPDSLCEGLAARGFRVVRFDNRDIGRSTYLPAVRRAGPCGDDGGGEAGRPPSAPYSLDDMAADAAGLLTALKIERAHIVGASMGGMIAQLVAINHPERTRSLVSIMSTTARPGLPQAQAGSDAGLDGDAGESEP